jgi:hypothetical protein
MLVQGHPPRLVEVFLQAYFPSETASHGTLRFIDFPFSLSTANLAAHKRKLTGMVNNLKK